MIGKTISHYKILEKLGGGGMGVVYKAQDLKLDRFVALKFLPSHIGADEEEKQRFIHEAKTVSKLDHPNICTVYEIDETKPAPGKPEDGQMFIALAYYKGETLKKRIEKGPLRLDEALDIGIQVAQGLNEAHSHDIVHRDIKPANIFVTSKNVVKVLDFGLAKLAGQSKLTQAGSTLGTVGYMSPEQAKGHEADHRTDIWSLGVVLYEMITGVKPFKGDYDQSVIYAIMNEEHEPITGLRTGVPMELERIINKTLKKNPTERYQNVSDLLVDLKKVGKKTESGISTKQFKKKFVPSIAVLPFVDMSPQKDQEYFCDGMAEEIINALTHISELHVVARTSAFSFKGEKFDVREIGQKLNVKTVIEGSVRKEGNRIRITAQLINIADGYHLWSEKYDRNMEDIFDIQDEISLAIVDNLKVKILGKEKTAVVKRYTNNLEAYNLYLKGRFYSELFKPKDFEKAIECFEKALTIDRNFALAYVGMGIVMRFMTLFGNLPPNDVIPKMRAYAEKALELDKNIGEAHCLLAVCYMSYDWDWPAAEEELKQALNLNPNSSYIHIYRSIFYTFTERHDEAVAAASRARELDPLSIFINFMFGHALHFAGRYDESIKDLKMSLSMNPNYYPFHYTLAYNYRKKSMIKEAFEETEKANNLSGGVPLTVFLLAIALYETGKKDRSKELLESLVQRAKSEYVPPIFFWAGYKTFGDSKKASKWLEKAYREHDSLLCYFRISPDDSDRIPPDPRLTEKLKGIKN